MFLSSFRTGLQERGNTALVISGWIVLLALLVFADSRSARDAAGVTQPQVLQPTDNQKTHPTLAADSRMVS